MIFEQSCRLKTTKETLYSVKEDTRIMLTFVAYDVQTSFDMYIRHYFPLNTAIIDIKLSTTKCAKVLRANLVV